jgi:hypothetical protein
MITHDLSVIFCSIQVPFTKHASNIYHVAPLNGYLARFKRIDSDRCPACGDPDESVEHYLIQCPGYAHERWALAHAVRKKNKHTIAETLLGDPGLKVPLANFINATHLFDYQVSAPPTSE